MSSRGLRCAGGFNKSGELLLRDIEEISEALYLDRCPSRKLSSRSHLRSHSAGNPSLEYPKSCANTRFLHQEFFCDEKKSSIWNWKPLKVLKKLSNRRFNICFFAHVHSIQGLSSNFNNHSVCIRWKKKEELQTCTAKVCKGVATFDETLMHRCSIYGNRKGPLHSAKYEPKYFLLYVYVVQAPGLDIGKHWVDLTKLLPLSFEELEQDKSMGMWNTSFKLTGMAKGAFLNVSFGFLPLRNDSVLFNRSLNVPELMDLSKNKLNLAKMVGRFSVSMKGIDTLSSTQSTNIKIPPGSGPSPMSWLSKSATSLFTKLDHSNMDTMKEVNLLVEKSESIKPSTTSSSESRVVEVFAGYGSDDCEYTVIDKGVEFLTEEHVKSDVDSVESVYSMTGATLEESVFVKDVTVPLTETYYNLNDQHNDSNDMALVSDFKCIETQCTKGILTEELESFHDTSSMKSAETDHPTDMFIMFQMENCLKVAKNVQVIKMEDSCELDDDTDVEETEFLNLLGLEQCVNEPRSETDPESPREILLREFEKDVLASRNCVFNLVEWGEEPGHSTQSGFQGTAIPGASSSLDFSFSNGTFEGQRNVSKSLKYRRNIRILEDLDTKTIRQYQDLSEENLQLWRLVTSGGFGSPICISPAEVCEPSQIGCLDPFMQAKHGELASSTAPSLSKHADTSATLAIHPSTWIVVPSNIGAGGTEILFCLASVGIDNLSSWIKKRMPLEDIDNESMQACPIIRVPSRHTQLGSQIKECVVENFRTVLYDKACIKINENTSLPCTAPDDRTSCATALEDIVNLALARIGVLLLNGLLIQHGMSSENTPSCIFFCSRKGIMCPMETCSNHSACTFEGAKQVEHERENAAELLNMAMSMDEWVKLYGGNAFCVEESDTQASEVGVAKDFESRNTVPGNLLVVSMTVQLKDPSENYKCIGAPMLVIIVAEHVKEDIAYYKLVGVHICGLKSEPGMKPWWGSVAEWEAGRDWLVANAMGQIEKCVMEIAHHSSEEHMTTFWSISYNMEAGLHGLKAGSYVRNSDLIIMH